MLLTIIAIFIMLIGGVFLFSAIIMSNNLSKVRTPRAKQLLTRRRRNTVILTVVTFVLGVALLVGNWLPGHLQGRLGGDAGYDLAGSYASVLSASGAEKAYLYLPSSVYAFDNDIAVKNERGEWFVYEKTENSEGKISYRWVNRGKNIQRYQSLTLGEEPVMTLQLGLDGRLYADGSFPYMSYDNERKEYSGKLAGDVSDFVCHGNTLFYITDAQELYALGLNEYGQMGDSSNKNKTSPTFIRSDIVSLGTSETHTLMIDVFGNLYVTGDNSDSQLGDGTMNDVNRPMKIMGGVQQAQAGNFFSVILAQNGDVYTCGRNNFGQCGNGSENGSATPEKIAEGAIKIVAGEKNAAYMTADGKVYAWGANTEQALSKDATEYFNVPTLVAENAYDIAITDRGLVILSRDRDVVVTGAWRQEKGAFTQTLLSMKAQVPEAYVSPVETEEKPDINELGKEEK